MTSQFAPKAYFALMLKTLPLLAVLVAPSIFPTLALSESQDELLHAQLLPGWTQGDGTRMTAMRVDLAPHWKTYWRAPGDAGIPPIFDWTGSENVGSVRFLWPTPQVFEVSGMETIGYLDGLTLPIEVTPKDRNAPVTLKARVDMGICKDICVPTQVNLTAVLLPDATEEHPQITAALAAQPKSGATMGLSDLSCDIKMLSDGLRITARLKLPDPGLAETVVFEPAEPSVWVSDATVQRNGATLTASADLVPGQLVGFKLDLSKLRLTILAGKSATETTGCK